MPQSPKQVTASREELTARTFVQLADSLVDDFDVIDMLTVLVERSVALLEAATGGILLADGDGYLRVLASSTDQAELLELFQVQNDQGPCLDSYRTGELIVSADLRAETPWPQFAVECVRAGFPSVCAVPLRHRARILGCLNLFMTEPVALSEADVKLARALAAVASITMVQDEAARDAAIRQGQLQHALDSRVAIEQAKGMIAERGHVAMDEAFSRLRAFARSNNLGLTEVARALVSGTVDVDAVAASSAHRRPGRAEAKENGRRPPPR